MRFAFLIWTTVLQARDLHCHGAALHLTSSEEEFEQRIRPQTCPIHLDYFAAVRVCDAWCVWLLRINFSSTCSICAADPCEYVNVANEYPDVLALMKNHLADYWSVKKKSEHDDIVGRRVSGFDAAVIFCLRMRKSGTDFAEWDTCQLNHTAQHSA